MPEIRGLTLWRPWAWAICHAGKRIENRDWPPPRLLVGNYLAIHAGKTLDNDAVEELREEGYQVPADGGPEGIVAVARVVGAAETFEEAVRLSGDPRQVDWFFGDYGWVLADVVAIPPVPCRGARGLWPLPPDVLALVRQRWKGAFHG